MDVAKYIGLFLLKNNKCYVHGLGTFEIKRKPAKYDGESLQASNHEIILTTSGNVDESLSNFIATNEQISISKATKSLKDFSEHVKATVKEGGEVAIPALGKIAEENEKLYFITAPQLLFTAPAIKAPKGAPAIKADAPAATTHQEQTPPQEAYAPQYEDLDEGGRKLNWGRIIITLLVLALLAAGAYYVWKNYLNKDNHNTNIAPPEIPQSLPADTSSNTVQDIIDTTAINSDIDSNDSITVDTTAADQPAEEVVAPTNKKMVKMRVVLNTYDTKERAHKRFRQLTSYGNKVEIIEDDTNYFHVAMPISAPAADTAYILDSLSRYFNPDGVFIY